MSLPKSVTSTLEEGKYVYSVSMTDVNGVSLKLYGPLLYPSHWNCYNAIANSNRIITIAGVGVSPVPQPVTILSPTPPEYRAVAVIYR